MSILLLYWLYALKINREHLYYCPADQKRQSFPIEPWPKELVNSWPVIKEREISIPKIGY
jgi:hypothetical protein